MSEQRAAANRNWKTFWYLLGSVSVLWFLFVQFNESFRDRDLIVAATWMLFTAIHVARHEAISAQK